MTHISRFINVIALVGIVLLAACTPITPTVPTTITYRDWEGAVPQAVFDAFAEEYGVTVNYLPYETQEEVVEEIRAGKAFDVVVLENQLVKTMVDDNLLYEINYKNVANFKNLSANFRDMAYDPDNAHSVPYSWGTTGLVVRADLVEEPVTGWADLWDPRYAGKRNGWLLPRYMIGVALKTLGYSLNSEDPAQLEEALTHLIALKAGTRLLEWEMAVSAPYLVSGEVVIAVGQADDVLVGQEGNENVHYVLPKEGGIMWGDNWTIPANAPNKRWAETLVDYLLRPEVSAQIINETYYWLPNDAALPLVDPAIRNNPAIFPSSDMVKNAEILMPLSLEGEALYEQIWQRFLDAPDK